MTRAIVTVGLYVKGGGPALAQHCLNAARVPFCDAKPRGLPVIA